MFSVDLYKLDIYIYILLERDLLRIKTNILISILNIRSDALKMQITVIKKWFWNNMCSVKCPVQYIFNQWLHMMDILNKILFSLSLHFYKGGYIIEYLFSCTVIIYIYIFVQIFICAALFLIFLFLRCIIVQILIYNYLPPVEPYPYFYFFLLFKHVTSRSWDLTMALYIYSMLTIGMQSLNLHHVVNEICWRKNIKTLT